MINRDPLAPLLRIRRRWVLAPLMVLPMLLAVLILAPQTLAGNEVTTDMMAGMSGQMTGAQCMRCHEMEEGFSHPSNVVPSMTVPDSMPLENNQVTCITCHLNTTTDHAAMRTSGAKTSLLRPAKAFDTGSFCFNCHTDASLSRKSMHPLGTERAHLMWRGGKTTDTLGLNDGSRSCMSCHDGTVAQDATRNNHPVAVPYRSAPMVGGVKSREMSFRAPSNLNYRIRIFNGQVGCESCHSPYASNAKLLVMSNESSKLCMSCHEAQ